MSQPAYHNTSNTRLEIGVAPTGLPNLVENPSGALGAWFWVTPVANTAMSVSGGALKFTTTPSQAAYWVSDYMPVAATKWVASRFDTIGGTAAHTVRVRYEWYNSAKALLSSSTQTSGLGVTATTNYVAALQAPASTAYVKIRFDFYNGTGTTNPSAGANYSIKNVMVTWANTNSFTTVRTNLLTNPSLETNTTSWNTLSTGTTAAAFARSNTLAATGSWSYRLTAAADGTTRTMAIQSNAVTITGGKDYTFQARFRSGTTARNCKVTIDFQDASGNPLAGGTSASANDSNVAFTLVATSATAPAGAAKAVVTATVGLSVQTITASENHYVDGLMLEQATAVGSYFDGSFASGGTLTYAWTGTANASTSTLSNTAFDFTDPTNWQNILGPTHAIDIVRNQMNPGTLTAEILDATLDPAVSSVIKPGVKVRLVTNTSGTWDNVFEGKTSRGTSAYVLDQDAPAGSQIKTRITLTATDNIGQAANSPEVRGMGGIDLLPYIFEGKKIPWNCNGSGNQINITGAVSGQPGTSLLDQIGFTRDTVLGYCWVDRFNVFQCWDNAQAPTATVATFADTGAGLSYSDIDVGYDTDSVINSVTFKFLRYNASTGDTTEVPYGPYVDQTAIDANNGVVVNQEFTIQNQIEVPSSFSGLAATILAANSTPAVTCRSLRMPVRNSAELAAATTIDLYGRVSVTLGTKFSGNVRATGIKHTIRTDSWIVDYEFDGLTRVATPRRRSGLNTTSNNDDVTDGTWITPVMGNSWVNSGGTDRAVQYMRKNGVVYIEGVAKSGTLNTTAFTLPAGYRPSGSINRATAASGNVFGRLAINSSGNFIPVNGSNVWISFACSFVAEQ